MSSRLFSVRVNRFRSVGAKEGAGSGGTPLCAPAHAHRFGSYEKGLAFHGSLNVAPVVFPTASGHLERPFGAVSDIE